MTDTPAAIAATACKTAVPEVLPREALRRLEAEMKQWSAEIAASGGTNADAFRYECIGRRLTAAEYGRPDAVVWAWHWYCDLVAQDTNDSTEDERNFARAAEEHEQRQRLIREEIARGHADNPRFQAFLDTLEDPLGELYSPSGQFHGWKYICWVSRHSAEFDRVSGIPRVDPRWQDGFTAYVREQSAKSLAPRLATLAPAL